MLAWQIALAPQPQEALAGASLDLVSIRQRQAEFNHPEVEKRYTAFDAPGHQLAVGFGQQVVRQPGFQILALHSLQLCPLPRSALPRLLEGLPPAGQGFGQPRAEQCSAGAVEDALAAEAAATGSAHRRSGPLDPG